MHGWRSVLAPRRACRQPGEARPQPCGRTAGTQPINGSGARTSKPNSAPAPPRDGRRRKKRCRASRAEGRCSAPSLMCRPEKLSRPSSLRQAVAPAKAGAHVSPDQKRRRIWQETWMPAAAGMTGKTETNLKSATASAGHSAPNPVGKTALTAAPHRPADQPEARDQQRPARGLGDGGIAQRIGSTARDRKEEAVAK